jgi:hypothetical protein
MEECNARCALGCSVIGCMEAPLSAGPWTFPSAKRPRIDGTGSESSRIQSRRAQDSWSGASVALPVAEPVCAGWPEGLRFGALWAALPWERQLVEAGHSDRPWWPGLRM